MLFGLPLDSLPGFNDPVPDVLAVVHHKSQQSDPALWAGRSVQLTQAGKRTLARARTPPPPPTPPIGDHPLSLIPRQPPNLNLSRNPAGRSSTFVMPFSLILLDFYLAFQSWEEQNIF